MQVLRFQGNLRIQGLNRLMFQRLDKLMTQSVRRAGAEKTVRAAMILDIAGQVLSARFDGHDAGAMKPVKFKDGVITVKCAESTATDDIRMAEAELVEEIGRRIGPSVVRGIRAIG